MLIKFSLEHLAYDMQKLSNLPRSSDYLILNEEGNAT